MKPTHVIISIEIINNILNTYEIKEKSVGLTDIDIALYNYTSHIRNSIGIKACLDEMYIEQKAQRITSKTPDVTLTNVYFKMGYQQAIKDILNGNI